MKTEEIIRGICGMTRLLEDRYDSPFTLDSHFVGSIGEVAAAERDRRYSGCHGGLENT